MLEFLTRIFYQHRIYTDEPKLFYKLYKWNCGLFTLLSLRRLIITLILCVGGFFWGIFDNPEDYILLIFGIVLLILILMQIVEMRRIIHLNPVGIRTSAQIRTLKIEEFIRRFITINGKALGRKEWKKIKEYDVALYNDLLCDRCTHCCYLYSLKIARIITDSTLIWGAIEEPFEEGHKYYAHAVILRNGYIYDSNMRQSEKLEDFIKLYKFKTYKKWNYDEYSREYFREDEREEFRKWCKKNNVLAYSKF